MRRIDRLLIEAKTVVNGRQLVCAMVECQGTVWIATAHFADEAKGRGVIMESSTHGTLEAAVDYLHKLGEQYPNSRDVPIIVDDIPPG